MTELQKFKEADAAAAKWVPPWKADGSGLFPDAPTVRDLTARRSEAPLALAEHRYPRPFVQTQDVPQTMAMGGGGDAPPCDCDSGSGSGGGV